MTVPEHPLARLPKEQIFRQLLQKELSYYKGILELSQQENTHLQGVGSPKELVQLGRKKKILLACVEEIDSALTPIKKYWKGKGERQDPLSLSVREDLAALDHILQEILDLDRRNQLLMQKLLTRLRDKEQLTAKRS